MQKIAEEEKSRNWCITMPPEIIEAIDEHRGSLSRSMWLRVMAMKQLGILNFPDSKNENVKGEEEL
jgi:hypothetical protein